jgi:type IV pilus assembly protein PilB
MNDAPIDLFRRSIDNSVLELIPREIACNEMIVPVEWRNETLIVAVSELENTDLVEKLQFVLNRRVEPRRATPAAIEFALRRYYDFP